MKQNEEPYPRQSERRLLQYLSLPLPYLLLPEREKERLCRIRPRCQKERDYCGYPRCKREIIVVFVAAREREIIAVITAARENCPPQKRGK
jgi:hypothetical protein